jgi:acetylornithine aminotransferase
MGRTGRLFAYEHFGIEPDVLTLAKALGNGFPIGAMIAKESLVKYLPAGSHGSTFGGNHLASRVGYETLKILMGRELLDNVAALSDYMIQRLRSLQNTNPRIVDIRGIGLHIGVELDIPCADAVTLCREKGLLVNCTAQKTIRILPPLNLSIEKAAEGLDIFESALAEIRAG